MEQKSSRESPEVRRLKLHAGLAQICTDVRLLGDAPEKAIQRLRLIKRASEIRRQLEVAKS